MSGNRYEQNPGMVLFDNEASVFSSVLTLHDDESWSEDTIQQYIHWSRPDLPDKLNGLALSSDHVQEHVDLGLDHLTDSEVTLTMTAALSTNNFVGGNGRGRNRKMGLYLSRMSQLQHKRHVESFVLSMLTPWLSYQVLTSSRWLSTSPAQAPETCRRPHVFSTRLSGCPRRGRLLRHLTRSTRA